MRRLGPLLLASLMTLPAGALAQQPSDGPPPNDYEDYRWEPGEGSDEGMDGPMDDNGRDDVAPMRRRFQDRLGGGGGGGGGGPEGGVGGEFRKRMRERFQRGEGGFGGRGGRRFQGGPEGAGGGQFGGGGGGGGGQFGGPAFGGGRKGPGKRGGGGFGGQAGFAKGALGGGKEMLARVREMDPALAGDLEALQDKIQPQDRKRLMMEIGRNVKQFVQESMAGGMGGGDGKTMRDTVQEIALMELRTVVSALQTRYGEADATATKGKLKGELEALFDRKVQLQEERMKVMESKLADLKKLIGERRTHKKEIVDQRLGELMGTTSKFEW